MTNFFEKNLKQLLFVLLFVFMCIWGAKLLITYFYPASSSVVEPIHQVQQNILPLPSDSEGTDVSIINEKTNVTLDQIKNSLYTISGVGEVSLVDGKYQKKDTFIEMTAYVFGDISQDSNGDALVVIESNQGGVKQSQLYAVLNVNGYPKTLPLTLINEPILSFSDLNIKNGKVALTIQTDNGFFTKTYIFRNNMLVEDIMEEKFRTYKNNEFGLSFLYPENIKVISEPIYVNDKVVSGTLVVNIHFPFLETYSMWTKKKLSIFISPGVCPYRNSATSITKNNIDFKLYNPSFEVTSNDQRRLKMLEYMTYQNNRCYTLVLSIEGPSPLSPDFPKIENPIAPSNLDEFFEQELIPVEAVFDTVRFVR